MLVTTWTLLVWLVAKTRRLKWTAARKTTYKGSSAFKFSHHHTGIAFRQLQHLSRRWKWFWATPSLFGGSGNCVYLWFGLGFICLFAFRQAVISLWKFRTQCPMKTLLSCYINRSEPPILVCQICATCVRAHRMNWNLIAGVACCEVWMWDNGKGLERRSLQIINNFRESQNGLGWKEP